MQATAHGELNKGSAKIIKADTSLQQKIGTGTIEEQKITKCQRIIDDNQVEFAPMAQKYLDNLYEAITKSKTDKGLSMAEAISGMTTPVMELKANASTFQYELVGNMANVMLSFLEAIRTLDKDAIEIVEAHHKTLTAIINRRMKGEGGVFGAQMLEELRKACQRYFAKDSA